jgi:hypothetical protein
MSLPIPRTAACAALLAGALAAPAAAADLCVEAPTCTGTEITTGLAGALTAAATMAGADTIHLGPGTYTGQHAYTPADSEAAGPVHVVGAGPEATRLTYPATDSGNGLVLGVEGSSVRGLSVDVPAGTANKGFTVIGDATDVAVRDTPGSTNTIGVFVRGALRGATVDVHGIAAGLYPGSAVEDTTLRGHTGAVLTGALGGPATVRRVRVAARDAGLAAGAGATLRVEDSLVELAGHHPSGAALVADSGTDVETRVEARHVTLVGSPGETGAPLAGAAATAAKGAAFVSLRDSIVTGFAHDVRRDAADGASAYADVAWTRTDSATWSQQGAGEIVHAHLTSADPGFAAGYALAPGSAMIDAGDPAAPTGGTDLAGVARVLPGVFGGTPRTDLGAFEASTPPAPEGRPLEDPIKPPALTLTVAGSKRQHGRRVVVRATASVDAALTARGRLADRRTRKVTAPATAGTPAKLVVRLPRSAKEERRVVVTVRAVAADGRVAKAARTIRVLRRAR